jgi:hypothetical protein
MTITVLDITLHPVGDQILFPFSAEHTQVDADVWRARERETNFFYCVHLSRFRLKTDIQSSFLNTAFYIKGRKMVLIHHHHKSIEIIQF